MPPPWTGWSSPSRATTPSPPWWRRPTCTLCPCSARSSRGTSTSARRSWSTVRARCRMRSPARRQSVDRDQLEQVTINNRLRRTLERAVAALWLFSGSAAGAARRRARPAREPRPRGAPRGPEGARPGEGPPGPGGAPRHRGDARPGQRRPGPAPRRHRRAAQGARQAAARCSGWRWSRTPTVLAALKDAIRERGPGAPARGDGGAGSSPGSAWGASCCSPRWGWRSPLA